jgi:hypothetical protein
LSRQTLSYVAGIIRRHRAAIGSCWRKLNPAQQALLVLAHLRKGETLAELAARAPKLAPSLRAARKAGHAFVVIDGTLIAIDRVAKDRPFYSGKHNKHGMNLQVISAPSGDILWVSGPLPGSVHDLTAARIWGIVPELAAAGLITLADKAYIGAGEHVLTPYRGRGKPESQKAPTALTPGCARPASAPMPSSRPGTSCASSAAAPGRPGASPRPSTSFKPERSEDEKDQS